MTTSPAQVAMGSVYHTNGGTLTKTATISSIGQGYTPTSTVSSTGQNQVAAGSVYQTSGGTLTKTGVITSTGQGYTAPSTVSPAGPSTVSPAGIPYTVTSPNLPSVQTGIPFPYGQGRGGNISSVGGEPGWGFGGGALGGRQTGFQARTSLGRYGFNAGVPLAAQQYTPGTTIARWFQPKREFLTT